MDENINGGVFRVFKSLMFPFTILFGYQYKKKHGQLGLNNLILTIAVFLIISTLPFHLGFINPLSKGYSLEFYGIENVKGFIGLFQKPHGASIAISISTIILLYFTLYYKNSIFNRIFIFLIIFVGLYSLLITYVRTGYAVLIFSIIPVIFFSPILKKNKLLLFLIVSLIIISFNELYTSNEILQMRFEDLSASENERGKMGSGRINILLNSILILKESSFGEIVFGIGESTFINRMGILTGQFIFPHNGFIYILVSDGIIGLIIIIYILFLILRLSLRSKYKMEKILLFSVLIGYFIFLLFQGGSNYIIEIFLALTCALNAKLNSNYVK